MSKMVKCTVRTECSCPGLSQKECENKLFCDWLEMTSLMQHSSPPVSPSSCLLHLGALNMILLSIFAFDLAENTSDSISLKKYFFKW